MGQSNTTPTSNPRVMFDDEGDNGLVLCDKYLPVEILIEIFCRADCKTLLSCQLVCKRWKMLMFSVWYKKTEQALGKPIPWDDKLPWPALYLACSKKPYERNLVKNHSGQEQLKYWEITQEGGDHWTVEEPPLGVPELPQTEPATENKQICFTTSYSYCCKVQRINLVKEGIHPYILDTYQPAIVVSEWYSCRWDCPAEYLLLVKLINDENKVIYEYKFKDDLQGEKQNQWLKVSHVFENYRPGLRTIIFEHVGKDKLFWAGHYGSKMSKASVSVKIPKSIRHI
ncbi:hypothetical protein PUN28_005314 [Cardiocondyla obscurior]